MKQQIALLIACASIICALNASAQTTAERLGAATGRYYGAVVFLKLISNSRCSSSLKISRDEYDLSRVKADINKGIARFATKDELREMPQFFSNVETDVQKDFTPIFNNAKATPDKCRQFVIEFTEVYYKSKDTWQTLTR